jgi:hypothetical protein
MLNDMDLMNWMLLFGTVLDFCVALSLRQTGDHV